MARAFKIVRGVTTNRVRSVKAAASIVDPSPQRAKLHYFRADKRTRGKLYTTICISLPVEDLLTIDDGAVLAGVSRSQLVRDAALAVSRSLKKGE
jgi:hypothetical protein